MEDEIYLVIGLIFAGLIYYSGYKIIEYDEKRYTGKYD